MKPGAIVVVGAKGAGWARETVAPAGTIQTDMTAEPLACVEVAGRCALERSIERYLQADVDVVSLLLEAESNSSYRVPHFRSCFKNVKVQVVNDLATAITQTLSEYSQSGVDHSFVSAADTYAETDLLDFFYFHREARQAITRSYDRGGPLDLGVVDCAQAQRFVPDGLSDRGECGGAAYFIRGYSIRLHHPRDLRQLATDLLRGKCESGPSGREIRPGVWVDEGADIHRRARIVAPAYIGCGAKVLEDALVTRFSCIERDCCIDCGTVIEDSSILANTHVGIWLDVCHAVVKGNRMLSLGRDVMIEISDSSLMRSNLSLRKAGAETNKKEQRRVSDADRRKPLPAPEVWQFGANFIQEQ